MRLTDSINDEVNAFSARGAIRNLHEILFLIICSMSSTSWEG